MPIFPDDLTTGEQWLVDAYDCDRSLLCSTSAMAAVFERAIRELGLHPLSSPLWHVFPGDGGITGLLLLTESHLSCHTFPERGFAALDLYSCRARPCWAWEQHLGELLGTQRVIVRRVSRGAAQDAAAATSPGERGRLLPSAGRPR